MCLIAVINHPPAFPELPCSDCGRPYRNVEPRSLGAYIVLGGEGWTLRDFYVSGGLAPFIPQSHLINIITFEQFVARANGSRL